MNKDQQTTEIEISEKVSENSRKHFNYRNNECLNCGQPLDLSDRYCPYCSQLNSTKPLTLGDFVREFFSSIISYDSRLRYTVTDLLFKPGTISKNYIAGKRLRYTNPFRFFLSVSIIYFLIYSVVTFFNPNQAMSIPLINIDRSVKDNDKKDEDSIEEEIFVLLNSDEKDTLISQEISKDSLSKNKKKIDPINKKDAKLPKFWVIIGDTIYNKNGSYKERVAKLNSMGDVQSALLKIDIFNDFYKDKKIVSSKKALDSLNLEQTRFNQWLYKRIKSFDNISESPGDFVNYLRSKIPFFVFFITPIFALFFWLLYMRRKFTYMEHLIFLFHIFSFVFLALIIGTIPDLIFGVGFFVDLIFAFIGPIYFYLALRKFYEQSHIKTIMKFLLLNFVFLISSIFAALVLFVGTAALY